MDAREAVNVAIALGIIEKEENSLLASLARRLKPAMTEVLKSL
jgi:hypothetical protein